MTLTYYQNQKIENKQINESGKIFLPLVIIFGILFLSVFYLAESNQLIAKNFQLRSTRQALNDKQEQSQRYLISSMEVRSLMNLENAAKNLDLVAIDKVEYLSAPSKFIALSR